MLEDVSESSMDSVIFQDDSTEGSLCPPYTTHGSGIVVAMLEDVSESSMDSVIFQDDSSEGALYPLYTTQSSGIVIVSDGALSFGDPERRRSPNRFSPVSLQHGGSSRASPLSDAESRDEPGKRGTKSEWAAADTAEHPQAVSGSVHPPLYTPDSSVYTEVPDGICEVKEYTEVPTNDTMERGRGYSADSETSVVFKPEGREETGSPVQTLSQQTSEPDVKTNRSPSVVNDEDVREQGHDLLNQNAVGEGRRSSTPLSVSENRHEGIRTKTDNADSKRDGNVSEKQQERIRTNKENTDSKKNGDSEMDDNQNSVLMTDQAAGKHEDTHITSTDQQLGVGVGGHNRTTDHQPSVRGPTTDQRLSVGGRMRKVNSMPEIASDDPDQSGALEVNGRASRKLSLPDGPVTSPVRRASAGSPAENIARTVKKKKRRRVKEASITFAASSSDVGNPTRSLTSSPTTSQETSKDMDTISIGTVDSIEEEPIRSSALDEDAFELPAFKKVSSAKQEVQSLGDGFESISLEEEREGTPFALAQNAAFSDSDSEAVPLGQTFPTDTSGPVGRHGDSGSVRNSMELTGNDTHHDGGIHPFAGSLREATTLSHAGRSLSMEKLPFRVGDLESEVIPPLIERLSALGVAPASLRCEEGVGNVHDLSSMKSLITEASKQKIASVRERVTKFGSSTKSLIRRVKEKNLLVSKTPSGSPPFGSGSLSSPLSKEDHDVPTVLHPSARAQSPADHEVLTPCPISLQPLLAQTEKTQEHLRDLSVLLDRDTLKTVLNTWAMELNHTLLAYHKELQHQQAQTGKTADHGQFHSGAGKLSAPKAKNLVSETGGAEVLGGLGQSLTTDDADVGMGQSRGEASGAQLDIRQAGDHGRGTPSQDINDDAVQKTNLPEELHTQNHTDGEDGGFEHNDREVLVTQHSRVVHTGHPIGENGLTAASEQMSAEQNISDQFSGKSGKFPEDGGSGSQVRTDESGEQDVTLQSGDEKRAVFVRLYFHFVPLWRLRRLVVEAGVSTVHATWCALIACCQGPSTSGEQGEPRSSQGVTSVQHGNGFSEMTTQSSILQLTSTGNLLPPHREACMQHGVNHTVTSTLGGLLSPAHRLSRVHHGTKLGHGDAVWVKTGDKDVTGALDYLRSGILPNKHAFLGHVASLFAMSPLRVTYFLSEIPRQVKLGDLLHLCCLHSRPVQHLVARYLALRLGVTPYTGRLEILKHMCVTPEVKLAVLDCLLHLRCSSSSSSSFHPSSSSSLMGADTSFRAGIDVSRFSPDMVNETLECVLTLLVNGEECSGALQICWQYSYWPGCLKLLKKRDQWQKALQLEVKLNDISLLNGHVSYGYTPRDVEQWQYLFHLYQQQSPSQQSRQQPSSHADVSPSPPPVPTETNGIPTETSMIPTETNIFPSPLQPFPEQAPATSAVGRDVNWGQSSDTDTHSSAKSVVSESEASEGFGLKMSGAENNTAEEGAGTHGLSWVSLGLLAAQCVGAGSTVQLLQTCVQREKGGASPGALSADFYTTCLTLSALHNQQKLVIHNMLEKVDSYLWAKKPVHLTPQVHYAAVQEKSAVQNSNTDDHNYHNLFARLSSAPVVDQQLAEDPDCHWGVHTNILRTCEACGIEASETVSLLEPGLLVFKCGHVFHKFCIPEKECPLC
ncbi:hypothetical protein ACOMHN_007675 [Nucella lapillus]